MHYDILTCLQEFLYTSFCLLIAAFAKICAAIQARMHMHVQPRIFEFETFLEGLSIRKREYANKAEFCFPNKHENFSQFPRVLKNPPRSILQVLTSKWHTIFYFYVKDNENTYNFFFIFS